MLFEHAAGYGVFKVREFEEVGMLLPQVEASVTDLSRFNGVVKIVGFIPFKTGVTALENINAISEGILPDLLQQFLDSTIPKSSKKEKVTLGVSDPKLGVAITEALGINCIYKAAVPEILRGKWNLISIEQKFKFNILIGIRVHFANLVKGFTQKTSGIAQLGLGHSYSRAKVKFNVNRVDNMIIQSIALVDQLDKDINLYSMRLREWYSYHFPELVKIVPENSTYARLVKAIKNRKELTDKSLIELEEIVMDSAKASAILSASKSSMGMDINPIDLINLEMLAERITGLATYRKSLYTYLTNKMNVIAPNLGELVGQQVGARLISHAGSLTNLAKYPASTVQILGAEKALFRALKTKGNTPKYGLLFHSTFIGRAGTKNKGRISRYLANKCSIASRIDCFRDDLSNIFGKKLKEQVEDRLKFYEMGEIPKKNLDVMREAMEEDKVLIKSLKNKSFNDVDEVEVPKKKKKKKKNGGLDETAEEIVVDPQSEKKKKKKKRLSEANGEVELNGSQEIDEPVTKKKKKRQSEVSELERMGGDVEADLDESPKKKKKKKNRVE